MISHKHKFIFVHIPKNAGSSLHQAFNYSISNKYVDHRGRERDHYRAIDYRETLVDYNDYFKFTFVRNPWSKLVSEFLFLKFGTKRWRPSQKRAINPKDLNFREFIFKLKDINFDEYTHFQKCHFIQQTDFLLNDDEDLIVDFIGRFENLQEDFNTICDKIGIPRQELPHINTSDHKHYTEYYGDETKQIVAEKYAKDIEYFGYEFGD
jgi:chondroitin 4-sulfotransferase 11